MIRDGLAQGPGIDDGKLNILKFMYDHHLNFKTHSHLASMHGMFVIVLDKCAIQCDWIRSGFESSYFIFENFSMNASIYCLP